MLKEFDIDAPSLAKEARQIFRLQSRNVTALYEKYFIPPDGTGSFWKLLVEIVTEIKKPTPRDLLGVLTIQIQGEPESFFKAQGLDKKKLVLNWLMEGIRLIALEENWTMEPFEQASKKVLANNFVNRWTWKKPLKNLPKTLTAEIVIEHDIEEARIVAQFRSMNGEICGTELLSSTLPSEFAFIPCLGKLEWLDSNTIRLKAKSSSESWVASFGIQRDNVRQ